MTWLPIAGELVAERFELEREIARGGMGAIWRAHHIRLDCPIAVKFIDPGLVQADLLRDRFQREARAAARLRGRHVVQILDYGVWRGAPYIAMELLEGETLAERLERVAALPLDVLLRMIEGMVRALTTAADLDIVHRDLKPDNVFIVNEGGEEYAKVLDFGVAKLRDPNLLDSRGRTKTGMVVGTPYYMSPEQADGTKAVDHRSDLWSLAIIVFECATGELPFYSEGFGNLVVKITTGPIPLPSSIRPDLPPAFDAWWLRAVERDPTKRFQSATELYDALCDALGVAAASPEARPSRRFSFERPDAPAKGLGGLGGDREGVDVEEVDRPSLLGLSGPNSSARPPASDPPQPHPAPFHGTFGGHARSEPGVVRPPKRRGWLIAGALAAAAGALVFLLRDPEPVVDTSPVRATAAEVPASATALPPAPESPDVVAPTSESERHPTGAEGIEPAESKTEPSVPQSRKPTPPRARPEPAAPEPAPPTPPAAPVPNPRLPDDI
jgi:serine/threonine protein kinase